MFHIIHTEQFLERHTPDSCNRIQTGQRQSGYTHGHEAGCHIDRNTEHFQKSCNPARKDLERSSCCGSSVCCGGCTCHAECQHCQKTFQNHGSISDFQHIFLICYGLGRSTGRYQAVESGNSSACNGNKQNREQISKIVIMESGVYRQIHVRMCNHNSKSRTDDHTCKHEGSHIITRLFHQPHRKNRCQENISKCDVGPGCFICHHRKVHTDSKSSYGAYQTKYYFFPAAYFALFLDQSEDNCKYHEQNGNGSGCSVDLCIFGKGSNSVCNGIGIKSTGYHIGKCGNHNQGKQPTEQKE